MKFHINILPDQNDLYNVGDDIIMVVGGKTELVRVLSVEGTTVTFETLGKDDVLKNHILNDTTIGFSMDIKEE